MARNKWNLESMNAWLNENIAGYRALETKWVEKPYQKQLWVLVKCNNETHESYWAWWNNVTKGYLCKMCYIENNNITQWNKEKVIDFYKKYNLRIVNINDWIDVDGSVLCIDKSGYKVFASITNLKGGKLPSPFKKNKHALENIRLYCKLYRKDYKIRSKEYTGIKSVYEWKYLGDLLDDNIDKKFTATADGFIHGDVQHPHLTSSKGEIRIEQFLIDNNINYKTQYTFDDCKHKNKLRFDFAFFNENNELIGLCEYQGSQHYIPFSFSSDQSEETKIKNLADLRYRDGLKAQYCLDKSIRLLVIKYTQFDRIDEILTKELGIN